MVSSQVYSTLEFQAVGNWWIAQNGNGIQEGGEDDSPKIALKKVPSGREDVFADGSISVKSKRALMKFLRHLMQHEDEGSSTSPANQSFEGLLRSQFRLDDTLHQPLLALSLSAGTTSDTSPDFAISRIERHMKSLGVFGAGFSSLIVKWGGLSEIAQAACRALAVGGGVYVLGTTIESVNVAEDSTSLAKGPQPLKVTLRNSDNITADWIIAGISDLTPGTAKMGPSHSGLAKSARAIYILSSPLEALFSSSEDSGPSPAGIVVVIPNTILSDQIKTFSYLFIHSSDTGECPQGQCEYFIFHFILFVL